jgi:hypothetical protein
MKIYIFLGFLMLTGCASQQQIAQKNVATDDNQCRSYGAAPGSDAYVGCRSQAAAARKNAEAIEDAAPATCHRGIGNAVICN